jgi:hypothetical protein
MKILVLTNRNIVSEQVTDENRFGEDLHPRGGGQVSPVWAERDGDGWRLTPVEATPDQGPSGGAFEIFWNQARNSGRNAVFYVHGFNKSFIKSLKQADEIRARYGVEVVTLSWPSNPGGNPLKEYKEARENARESAAAMNCILEELQETVGPSSGGSDARTSFNLLCHSQGNFLLEQFVRSGAFGRETGIFDNIVLNAADVDLKSHTEWVDGISLGARIYVTINENDAVLSKADLINPERLGSGLEGLNARGTVYADLTKGANVGRKHRHFESTAKENPVVERFFRTVLSGGEPLPTAGFKFRPRKNAWTLRETRSARDVA